MYSDIHTEEKVKINDKAMNSFSLDFQPEKFIEQLKLEEFEQNAQTIDNTDVVIQQEDEKMMSKESQSISEDTISLDNQEDMSETSFESNSSQIPEEEQNNKLKRNPDMIIQQECEEVKDNNNMINNFKLSESYQKMSEDSKKAAELIINYMEGDINNLELSDDQRTTDIKRKIQTDYNNFIKFQEENVQTYSLFNAHNGPEASMIQRQNQVTSYSPVGTQNIEPVDQLSFKEISDQEEIQSAHESQEKNNGSEKYELALTNLHEKPDTNQRASYIQSMTDNTQSDAEKAKVYKQYILSIIKQIQNMDIYDAKNIIKIEKIQKQRIQRDVKIKDFNLYKNKICETFYINMKGIDSLSQLKQVQIIYNFLIQNKDQLKKKQNLQQQIDYINSENSMYNPNKTSPNLKRKQMLISEKIYISKQLQYKLYELINMYSENIDDSKLYNTIVDEYMQQVSRTQSNYIL